MILSKSISYCKAQIRAKTANDQGRNLIHGVDRAWLFYSNLSARQIEMRQEALCLAVSSHATARALSCIAFRPLSSLRAGSRWRASLLDSFRPDRLTLRRSSLHSWRDSWASERPPYSRAREFVSSSRGNSSLHQFSHGFATHVRGFATKTKGSLRNQNDHAEDNVV